jgi:hypothetical protein
MTDRGTPSVQSSRRSSESHFDPYEFKKPEVPHAENYAYTKHWEAVRDSFSSHDDRYYMFYLIAINPDEEEEKPDEKPEDTTPVAEVSEKAKTTFRWMTRSGPDENKEPEPVKVTAMVSALRRAISCGFSCDSVVTLE